MTRSWVSSGNTDFLKITEDDSKGVEFHRHSVDEYMYSSIIVQDLHA
jgi:hypothetical protein